MCRVAIAMGSLLILGCGCSRSILVEKLPPEGVMSTFRHAYLVSRTRCSVLLAMRSIVQCAAPQSREPCVSSPGHLLLCFRPKTRREGNDERTRFRRQA